MQGTMETVVSSANRTVVIRPNGPTILMGERINPSGKKDLAQALVNEDFDYVCKEARTQVAEGADILDINVGITGVDEPALMKAVVTHVMAAVDVPLCLDSSSSQTLAVALEVYQGRPLINSVKADEASLDTILPLVKRHNTAVIALPMDEKGIPADARSRLRLARKIIERAEALAIPRSHIVMDALAMSVGAEGDAGRITLKTIGLIKRHLGVNQTLGVSNVSFGVPNRGLLNTAFLSMALAAGVNCPMVDPAQVRRLAADLVLGHDPYAGRYLKDYRRGRTG